MLLVLVAGIALSWTSLRECIQMLSPIVHITSRLLWCGVLVAAPVDVVFVSILASRISDARFRVLRWRVAVTTAAFFTGLWAVLASYLFWAPVYHYFFPEWARWLLPLAYGLGFGVAALISGHLAVSLRGSAVTNFCVLMGLWGMAGHIWAVHRGLMEKPPMLQGASPEAAIVFSGFEFVFYAGLILTVSTLLDPLRDRGE